MSYHKLLEELTQEGIEYLAVGGVAVILSGYIRITMDLDLLINLKEQNLRKVVNFFNNRGYKPLFPVALNDT